MLQQDSIDLRVSSYAIDELEHTIQEYPTQEISWTDTL